jgi:hypothetical protein
MTELANEHKRTVAVVYLCWLPYEIGIFQRFIQSYLLNPAGYGHRLVIVFNGITLVEEDKYSQFKRYATDNLSQYEFIEMNSGFDIDAYFLAAQQTAEDLVLFLNSFSVFCDANWLRKYIDSYPQKSDALIGATASNQSLYSTVYQTQNWRWERQKSTGDNFKKFKMFLKAFFYWRFLVKPFPNPHIRTNAFFISRLLFLSLQRRRLNKKFDAYLFESGRQSLTNQVVKRGFPVWVVDRRGKKYGTSDWMSSNTFWCGDQENLLVADNQTSKYDHSDLEMKRYYNYLAWGIKK